MAAWGLWLTPCCSTFVASGCPSGGACASQACPVSRRHYGGLGAAFSAAEAAAWSGAAQERPRSRKQRQGLRPWQQAATRGGRRGGARRSSGRPRAALGAWGAARSALRSDASRWHKHKCGRLLCFTAGIRLSSAACVPAYSLLIECMRIVSIQGGQRRASSVTREHVRPLRFGGSSGPTGDDRAARKLDVDSRGLPRRVSDDVWSSHTSRQALHRSACIGHGDQCM